MPDSKGTLRGVLQKEEKVQLTQKFILCDLGCFLGLGLEDECAMRLCYGRDATFNVDSMLKLMSDIGRELFVLPHFRKSQAAVYSFSEESVVIQAKVFRGFFKGWYSAKSQLRSSPQSVWVKG